MVSKSFLGHVGLVLGATLLATSAQAVCVGACGTLGADGVVSASPLGGNYNYITTNGGVVGAGSLGVGGETNGSEYTSGVFSANAGDLLDFYFAYVTSDGQGFEDYGWSQLQNAAGSAVATIFSARTTSTGDVVPGFGLPPLLSTLTPANTPIIAGAPTWSPLGGSSNTCWAAGCGYTNWIKSSYAVGATGNYRLAFGVTNLNDQVYDTGMAFAGATIGGNPIPTDDVPEPAVWAMLVAGFGMVGSRLRARSGNFAGTVA